MLSETRKADRVKMAAQLQAAMLSAGAVSAIVAPCSYEPARLDVTIDAPGGARIVVDFDGKSCQPNVHVATWNTGRGVFLNPGIGHVNPYHYGKANRVGEGLEHLIRLLSRDLAAFVDGSGYLSHDSREVVDMAARYAANGWQDPRVDSVDVRARRVGIVRQSYETESVFVARLESVESAGAALIARELAA